MMKFLRIFALLPVFAMLLATAAPGQGVERDKLRAFLEITGFDVAIANMQQTAMAGPGIAGSAPDDFGREWVALAEKIFDPDMMVERALDMMSAVMPEELVDHGAGFYASELGQRLVAVENAAFLTDEAVADTAAEAILRTLAATNPARIEQYRAMGAATGGADMTVRAVIEIQFRYLLAAMNAGVVELDIAAEDLRAILEEQAPAMKAEIAAAGIVDCAYAYRDISDEDVSAYLAALEDPAMRQVYEILNAIQYQIMAERYEELAGALAGLAPQQDI